VTATSLRRLVAGTLLAVGSAGLAAGEPPQLTHGVAAGEVRDTSAIVWGRCDRSGTLRVALGSLPVGSARVTAEHDFTGKVAVDGLAPATAYDYRAWCAEENGGGESHAQRGAFRTAPRPGDATPVRFAWGGDLGGQNVCRDAARGYPIFDAIAARDLDFFVGLGDMIYADDACSGSGRYGNVQLPGIGAAATLDAYWAHWRYNRDDPTFRRLLARTPYYAVWDDHEVANDFGPLHDTLPWKPDRHLLPLGRAAFVDYAPMLPEPPQRLYRTVRWGRHLELFVLDTRQYRDANFAEDTAAQPKSMLGAEQRAWLEGALGRSDATWKVIVSSVPLSLPTGAVVRDGWADHGTRTGFERELVGVLRRTRESGIRNLVWITTDVHFAAVFRYRPFADAPGFTVHEIVTGPLNAGITSSGAIDETLRPELLFSHGPVVPQSVTSLEQALGWFNFGVLEIDADGALAAEVIDARGKRLYRLSLAAGEP
jgi:alkaline phosphatase D